MGDRRQVHRRETIEVELDDGRVFVAKPLPWIQRNDFGGEILRQNTEAVNEAVRLFTDPETNIPQLEAKLKEKLNDPLAVLVMGYPDSPPGDLDNLTFSETIDLILVAMEVNQLEHLNHLVDPNSLPPMLNGGNDSSAEGEEIGQKIESSASSLFSVSPDTPSSNSPTEK